MKKYVHCFSFLLLIGMVWLGISARKQPVTLFMVGDSTMADKTELEASPERGWGQLFPTYLTDDVVVQNHAKNGRSTKSFLAEGRWDEVMNRAKKGDIVIIQFGHNDTKQSDSTRYTTVEQYEQNLIRMITDAKKKKMHVILCTPISRRYFKDGVFYPRHGAYPEAARRVATRMEVPLLDMEAMSAKWLTQLGDDASKSYFMNVSAGECTKFPDGKTDNTHLRENGALEIGRMAAKQIRKMDLEWLSPYVVLKSKTEYTTPCNIQ